MKHHLLCHSPVLSLRITSVFIELYEDIFLNFFNNYPCINRDMETKNNETIHKIHGEHSVQNDSEVRVGESWTALLHSRVR